MINKMVTFHVAMKCGAHDNFTLRGLYARYDDALARIYAEWEHLTTCEREKMHESEESYYLATYEVESRDALEQAVEASGEYIVRIFKPFKYGGQVYLLDSKLCKFIEENPDVFAEHYAYDLDYLDEAFDSLRSDWEHDYLLLMTEAFGSVWWYLDADGYEWAAKNNEYVDIPEV